MILLFGAHGQLGRELRTAAAAAGIGVAGPTEAEVDIADPAAVGDVIDRSQPELIINAAAYTNVDQAESEPEMAWRVNATGPKVVAQAADRTGVPLIHISTDYVFDGSKTGGYREDDAVAPINVYGQSKVAGEEAVRESTPRHLILRTAWLYSRHGHNFAKTMIRLASERDELRVVADQFGTPTAASDLARTIIGIAPRLRGSNPPYGTYHLAGDGATNWADFADRIVEAQALITHRRPAVVPISTADYPTAARRPQNSALDSTHFAVTFGLRLGPWQNAVGPTVAAILSSEEAA